jgi:hypothetical protein
MTHNPQSRPATLADFAPGNRIRIEAHIKQRYQNTINFHRILTNPNMWDITILGQMGRKATEATIYPQDVGIYAINISDIQIIEHTPGEENYPDQLVLTARIDTVETWETIE